MRTLENMMQKTTEVTKAELDAATAARKREDEETLAEAMAARRMAEEGAADKAARRAGIEREWEALLPTLPPLVGADEKQIAYANVLSKRWWAMAVDDQDEFSRFVRAGRQSNGLVVTARELDDAERMLSESKRIIHITDARWWLDNMPRACESCDLSKRYCWLKKWMAQERGWSDDDLRSLSLAHVLICNQRTADAWYAGEETGWYKFWRGRVRIEQAARLARNEMQRSDTLYRALISRDDWEYCRRTP